VLSRYVDGVVVRTFAQETVAELARHATIPVINGLTDTHHPCQVLSDLMTMEERFGDLTGLKVAWVGDGNNMANSWITAAMHLDFALYLACPPGYEPDAALLAQAKKIGARVFLGQDPEIAVAGAQVINTDVWASMGQEDEAEQRRPVFSPFRVTRAMLAAAPDALVLHCLPAHRGEEIDADVLDSERSIVFDQAENRLWAQMAVLTRLVRPRRPFADVSELPEPTPLPFAIGSRSQGRPGPG